MSIISSERLGHTYGDRWLFKQLTFGIGRGDRVALVGINGTGKSTLLKLLAGKLAPNEGLVVAEKGVQIGYLEQEPDFKDFNTVHDFILATGSEQQKLIWEYEELLAQSHPDPKRLEQLYTAIGAQNAWEYEHQIKTILFRLGITDLTQTISTLSGGQKKRLALAKLLIDDPEVYILDEPTNHLDIETIEWLEKLLLSGHKTVLLVTHDRYFLDAVCNEILELDRGELFSYKGNYSYYLEKKAEREHSQQLLAEKSKNLWRKELEWMRRQPQARGTKSKARIEAFYELEKKSKLAPTNKSLELDVQTTRLGNKIIELQNVDKSFGVRHVINGFNYIFKKGDRIGLAGKNGSGKSTFLNLVTGAITPDHGQIVLGETVKIGYYKQTGLNFKEDERVIDVVKAVAEYITLSNGEQLTASQLLTNFLFPPKKQHDFIKNLSGGEKKRLQLMRVLMANPNVLILDEPTNDLDIDTLNVLEEFLENYTGVLLLVSHDRYLIDKLTEQLFIFDGSGNVRIYNGNYSDFKLEEEAELKKKKAEEKAKEEIKDSTQKSNITPAIKKKLSFKETKELEMLNEEIPALEEKIKTLTDELSITSDHIELTRLADQIASLNQELDDKSERWLTLSEYN